MCLHVNQGFWRVLGDEGGPFCLHRETLTFMGPAAYQNTGISDRGEQKSSKLWHNVMSVEGSLHDVFGSHSALKS